MAAPIAIGRPPFAEDAVRAGGGVPVKVGEHADALVWLRPPTTSTGWRRSWSDQPEMRWVQLPFAGVENVAAAGLIDHARTWTCAKGSYAEPVAEHALTAGPGGAAAAARSGSGPTRWGPPAGTSLYGAAVTILGGGGITEELLRLLAPFGVEATVVRRQARPVPGAARTVDDRRARRRPAGALVVFVALALTPETEGIIGAPPAGGHGRTGLAGQRGPGPARAHRRPGGGAARRGRSPAPGWT